MPDAQWLIERRDRRYRVVKKVVSGLGTKTFTARSLIPRVRKSHWSYERWNVSIQTITGALNRLRRERFIQIVGREHVKGRNKRYSSSIYQRVGVSFEEE